MKTVIFLLMAIATSLAYSATDQYCISECTKTGYGYEFCDERCSYKSSAEKTVDGMVFPKYEIKPRTRTDNQCMSNCANLNYGRGYCKDRCSYEDK